MAESAGQTERDGSAEAAVQSASVQLGAQAGSFEVEVAYALPEKQALLKVRVSPGVTALQAAQQSGIAQQFTQLDLGAPDLHLGVFGQAVALDHPLQPGDRVEIYRPLKADPKEARKARAARARS